MRTLVIETATSTCSVALIDDGTLIASDAMAVGRGHAERLLPMIAALPCGGRADAIRVDCGPGSFTGIRVGIAAARGLGFVWQVPVRGYSSLELIAATWFAAHPDAAVDVVIEGGHGEVFHQVFARGPLRATSALASLPAEAVALTSDVLVGNAAVRVAAAAGRGAAHEGMPDAVNVALLETVVLPPRPIYGRGADAKPMVA